jgi:hypothetical protein
MAKIDEVKEILNTLRVIFSVLVGVFVVLMSGLIKRIDNGKIDIFFCRYWYFINISYSFSSHKNSL